MVPVKSIVQFEVVINEQTFIMSAQNDLPVESWLEAASYFLSVMENLKKERLEAASQAASEVTPEVI